MPSCSLVALLPRPSLNSSSRLFPDVHPTRQPFLGLACLPASYPAGHIRWKTLISPPFTLFRNMALPVYNRSGSCPTRRDTPPCKHQGQIIRGRSQNHLWASQSATDRKSLRESANFMLFEKETNIRNGEEEFFSGKEP
ncbi:Hypothetical protein NTJ_05862 [Nesidiocoris tenuis]|uniref:Uncharacterized protein n=1 Tax=Nesidiocoris tenuis TaxID=355587 RepID=A0ABN7AM76_9HEMI|nr:Hypothetical protein NTJ_05862 [Nesidiocoris tenuis]